MKISLSLILKGEEHISKFRDYSANSLSNALSQLSNETKITDLIFFISVDYNEKSIISDIFNSKFKKFSKKLIFDNDISKLKHFSYIDITKIQKMHLKKSIMNNSNFFLFLYSDMIYTKKSLLNSYKLIDKKKVSAVCSFALSLNINKFFKKFIEKIYNDEDYIDYFLENKENLISNFHKKFEYGKLINFRSNFIYISKKNGIVIKSQHMHPIMINLKKIKSNFKILSLDENISELFDKIDEIYIEKDLRKISIFSCDFENIKRNNIDVIAINSIDKKKVKILNLLSLKRSISNKKNINIFYDNYLYCTKNNLVKVKTINRFLNYIILEKSGTLLINFTNNSFDISLNNYTKFKAIILSIFNSNFFYNNINFRYVYNYLKTNIVLKNSFNSRYNQNIEAWLIVFCNLNFVKKMRLLFHL